MVVWLEDISDVDRKLHICTELEEIGWINYPPVSNIDFSAMEQEFVSDSSSTLIYPFVGVNTSGEQFVDIYIWDMMLYPNMYKRYVIADGYSLPLILEKSFLSYIRKPLYKIDENRFKKFNKEVMACFPKWNYLDYSTTSGCYALEHIYYASHHCGAKEILYKAGLYRIAHHLNGVSEYNLIGSTPSEIFGNNTPIRLLRIMNQKEFVYDFYHLEDIETCKEVYRKYGGFIGDKLPNRCQWIYLTRLYRNNGMLGGHAFMRSIYNRLSEADGEWVIDRYEEFLLFRSRIPGLRHWKIPKAKYIIDAAAGMEYVAGIKADTACDELILSRKHSENYEYIGDAYSVIMPERSEDFFIEEEILEYWALDKIEPHASGEITVLFLRRNESLRTPYIMIEVMCDEIIHTFGKIFMPPNDEMFLFIQKYAEEKHLKYNKQELIVDALWYREFGE